MSRENVEIVRRSIEAFAATQRPTGLAAPDFVWDMRGFDGWPDKREYRGMDEVMDFFHTWVAPYEEWVMEPEHILDAGGNQVAATIRQRARVRGASAWVEARYWTVYTLEAGKVKRIQWYTTREDALEAVGLRK